MDKENMIETINEYITDCKMCDCEKCDISQIEECYYRANNISNNIFAESIDYGGYNSSDDFWDDLLG